MARSRFFLFILSSLGLLGGCKWKRVAPALTSNASLDVALRPFVYNLACSSDTAKMQRDISAVMACKSPPSLTLVFTNKFISTANQQRQNAWFRAFHTYPVIKRWYFQSGTDTAGLWQKLQHMQSLPVKVNGDANLCMCDALVRVALKHTALKKQGKDERFNDWPAAMLFITVSQPIPIGKLGLVAYYVELAGKEDSQVNAGYYFVIDTTQQPQRLLESNMIFIR